MSIGLIDNNIATKGSASMPKSTRAEFSKEMDGFEAKLKDRLENGKPKYTMGMTSMTEDDWESLMHNVDSYMKKVREMKDANKEKQEESLEEKIYKKVLVMSKDI